MADVRIIDQTEITTLSGDEYLVTDSSTEGTKKITPQNLVAAVGVSGSGLTNDIKVALLECFEKVAWIDENGQDYYDALEAALNPPANLVSISAVYTQSGTVYDTASLDTLKPDLVVTAHYVDSSTATVTSYTLSGTLTAGTSTITVSYGGKTTTFNVTVTHDDSGDWDFVWQYTDGAPLLNDMTESYTGGSGHAATMIEDGYRVRVNAGIDYTSRLVDYTDQVPAAGGGVIEAKFYVPTNELNGRNYYAETRIGNGTHSIRVMFLNNNTGGTATGKWVGLVNASNLYSGTKIMNSWSYDTVYTVRIEYDSDNELGKVYINGSLVADNIDATTMSAITYPGVYAKANTSATNVAGTVWQSVKVAYGLPE